MYIAVMSIEGVKIVWIYIAIIMYVFGLWWIGNYTLQHQFVHIMVGYGACFGAYMVLYSNENHLSYQLKIGLAIILPIVCIWNIPTLSNDWCRFIWDGTLSTMKINPYTHLPTEIIHQFQIEEMKQLVSEMNSPNYYTVYPSFLQALYYVACTIGKSTFIKVVILKVIFLIIHLCGLFYWLKIESKKVISLSVFFYFLNPLVINEGIGNLHAEIVMIPLIIIAYFYLNRSAALTAFFFMLAVSTKILPLIIVPYLFFALPRKQFFHIAIWALFFGAILFAPMLSELPKFASSLDLYFQKFEFNASFYYVFRFLGIAISGYNLISYIGPMLGIISLMMICFVSYILASKLNDLKIFWCALICFTLYFLSSSIVHPWYVLSMIFFASMVNARSYIIWSLMVVSTYLSYDGGKFNEKMGLVALEYGLFFLCFYIFDWGRIREVFRSSKA